MRFSTNAKPFFLKLCPRVVFDPESTGLIHGMYIPLDYWRRLEIDPCIEGLRDGRAVSFGNAGRYFNNTVFVALVAEGWIGTTGAQTEVLDALIRESVESGRTITIAVKSKEPNGTGQVVAREDVDWDDLLETEPPDGR